MPYEPSSSMVLAQTIVRNKVDLKEWSKQTELAAQAVVYKLGQETRDRARAAAPVLTGALRASIYVTRPGTQENQAAGRFARGRASEGYSRAINAAVQRSPDRLERIIDNPLISERTQRDLSTEDHDLHMTRHMVDVSHRTPFKRLGTQRYASFDMDERTIMPFADVSRGTFFVTVGAAVFYAGYVEYGTHRTRAQPFLTPAVNWAQTQLGPRLKAAIGADAAAIVIGKRR